MGLSKKAIVFYGIAGSIVIIGAIAASECDPPADNVPTPSIPVSQVQYDKTPGARCED